MSLQLRSRKILRSQQNVEALLASQQQKNAEEALNRSRSEDNINLENSENTVKANSANANVWNQVQTQDGETNQQTKAPSKTSQASSKSLRRKKLITENFVQKIRLEQELLRKEQEVLDHQFKLNLCEIDEQEEDYEEDTTNYDEFGDIGRPNIAQWMDKKNPWDSRSQSPFNQEYESKSSRKSNRQSVNSQNSMTDYPSNSRHQFQRSNEDQCRNPPIHEKQKRTSEAELLNKFIIRQSLPKDLPFFDGNPLEWPNFIYQFRTSTSICHFTNEENQCRLQKALRGNARKAVQSLLITPHNLQNIVQVLQDRFGRPEQIITVLIDKLRKFPIIKQENMELFIAFSDETKNFIATIQSLEEKEHLYNPMLLQELLNKLPNGYKLSWVEYLSKLTKTPKFKLVEFAKWMDKRAMAMTKVQNMNYNDDSKTKNRKDFTFTTTLKKKCICCEEELHKLYTCDKFKNMSAQDKWSFVTSKKICFSCLIPFHMLKDCKNKKKCPVENCQKLHHKLLHTTEDSHETEINLNC